MTVDDGLNFKRNFLNPTTTQVQFENASLKSEPVLLRPAVVHVQETRLAKFW